MHIFHSTIAFIGAALPESASWLATIIWEAIESHIGDGVLLLFIAILLIIIRRTTGISIARIWCRIWKWTKGRADLTGGEPTPRAPTVMAPRVPRAAFFVERQETVARIDAGFENETPEKLVQVLWGFGGVGKTTLAAHYCRVRENIYGPVFWLEASSRALLTRGFRETARSLALRIDPDTATTTDVVEAVLGSFAELQRGLVIFDGAPNAAAVFEYLPRDGHVRVLITSRERDSWKQFGIEVIPVNVLDSESAIQLLIECSGCDDRNTAAVLAKDLGYLPLALRQAGTYVQALSISLEAYLCIYHREKVRIFGNRGSRLNNLVYRDTVLTTWAISFGHARHKCPESVDLFCVCCFYASNDIPIDYLIRSCHGASDWWKNPRWLRALIDEPQRVDRAIRTLASLAIIDADDKRDVIGIHPLVREVLLDQSSVSWGESAFSRVIWLFTRFKLRNRVWRMRVGAYGEIAARLLKNAFPYNPGDGGNWRICNLLLPHVYAIRDQSERFSMMGDTLAQLFGNCGFFLAARSGGASGERYYSIVKASDVSRSDSRTEIAEIEGDDKGTIARRNSPDLRDAEDYLRRAIEYRISNSSDEAMLLRNVWSYVLLKQGRADEAKRQFVQILKAEVTEHGPTSPILAAPLYNVAVAAAAEGDMHLAEESILESLRKFEEWSDPTPRQEMEDLQLRLRATMELANETQDVRLLAVAKLYLTRIVQLLPLLPLRNTWPHALALAEYAHILRLKGEPSNSLPIYLRAISIGESCFGDTHPNIAVLLVSLGVAYDEAGLTSEAVDVLARAHDILLNSLGIEHAYVRIAASHLAKVAQP